MFDQETTYAFYDVGQFGFIKNTSLYNRSQRVTVSKVHEKLECYRKIKIEVPKVDFAKYKYYATI